MIFGDWIGRWGLAYPEQEALVDTITGRRYTYGRLAAEVNKLANYLRLELNVAKGDRVACLSFNRSEYILLFFALSRLGAILTPLNFRLASNEFVYFMEDASPKALFYDLAHEPAVDGFKNSVAPMHYVCFDRGCSLGASLAEVWPGLDDSPPPELEIKGADPQLIIYTSGTTGLPKGVILTHEMITWNSMNTNLGWDLRASDSTILHPAMFYTAGWNVFTLPLFQCRAKNVLTQGFEADQILELIEKERITLFFGVPTMYQMMLESEHFDKADLTSLRFAVSGGAPLNADLMAVYRQKKNLRIWEGYGLTEVGPNDFMANGKPGTLGTPTPFTDVRLIDEDGQQAPPGADGEIMLRGPGVSPGYWNKPEATLESRKDGWFITGDLGRVDKDHHFAIVGRKKDMIISGGANIYPAEIEKAIEEHPDVSGAAVIGVPDPKWGEVGKAVVELKPARSLSLEELVDFLSDKLGKFKLPKYLARVDELPRTPASNKIQKFKLKKAHGKADNA